MGDANAKGPKGCSTTPTCPEDAAAAGSAMDDDCDEDDGEVLANNVTTCPKDGEVLPAGTTMPAGCTTTVPGGTTATAASVAPGAVLAAELQNAPAAPAADHATVLGIQLERPAAVGGAAAAGGTSVLGAALARTGLSFTVLAVALALALLAAGFLLRRSARSEV